MKKTVKELQKELELARKEENKIKGFEIVVKDEKEGLKRIYKKAHELTPIEEAEVISEIEKMSRGIQSLGDYEELREKLQNKEMKSWLSFFMVIDSSMSKIIKIFFDIEDNLEVASIPNIDLLYNLFEGNEKIKEAPTKFIEELNYFNKD